MTERLTESQKFDNDIIKINEYDRECYEFIEEVYLYFNEIPTSGDMNKYLKIKQQWLHISINEIKRVKAAINKVNRLGFNMMLYNWIHEVYNHKYIKH